VPVLALFTSVMSAPQGQRDDDAGDGDEVTAEDLVYTSVDARDHPDDWYILGDRTF